MKRSVHRRLPGESTGCQLRGAKAPGRARRAVPMQVPAPFEYERATSVEHALELLRERGPEARLLAGGHSLLPMMKLRLAAPEHLIDLDSARRRARLHPPGGRRGPHRRDDAPPRPARVRARRRAAADHHRRRDGDRRPGGAQPRHDRRRALPGRPGRGPVVGLRGARRDARRPRARRRAHAVDAGVPPRPVRDGRRGRRDARRGAACRCATAPAAPTRRSSAAAATGRWPPRAPR